MTKHTMFLDLPGAKLEDFSLGDVVEAKVKGKIIELQAPRTIEFGPDDKEKLPPAIGIEVIGNSKVALADNEFAKLSQDEDDDDD